MLMRGDIFAASLGGPEGPVAADDDRTSAFPPSCCCWRGACRWWLCQRGGRLRGQYPGAARRRPRNAVWRSCAGGGPLPRAGTQVVVHASVGCLPLLGDHTLLSAVVARRMPTLCDIVSWVSSGLCQ
jgi:hypothetical protein